MTAVSNDPTDSTHRIPTLVSELALQMHHPVGESHRIVPADESHDHYRVPMLVARDRKSVV